MSQHTAPQVARTFSGVLKQTLEMLALLLPEGRQTAQAY